MSCRRIENDLKAYCDGELGPWRRLIVRRHLARCPSCREEVSQMTQMSETLRAEDEATEGLSPTLRAKILAQAADAPSSSPLPSLGAAPRVSTPRPPSPVLAWGAAAAVLLLWFILYPVLTGGRGRVLPDMAVPSAPQAVLRAEAPARPRSAPAQAAAGYPGDSPAAAAASGPSFPDDLQTRQVHKEATLSVEVTDAEARSDQVAQAVKSVGGFVASNTLSTGEDGRRSAEMTLRVPTPQFEGVLGQITRLGRVLSRNVTGEDITEKVSDADSAESVLEDEVRQADSRLRALGKKAGWRDAEADREVRTQLAQARQRLLVLRKLGTLSTITLSLSEPAKQPPAQAGFLGQLRDSGHAATQSLLTSAGALLSLLIWVLAYAPLRLPLALVIRYARRRWGQNGATPS